MPKPKTSPDLSPKPYRRLKTDLAAKLSPRSAGGITYVLLADSTDTPELHLAVTANEGGGLWSKEAVRLDRIEAVLDAYAGQPFPTKALRGAMVGKSSNNPPFCLAVLKDLGLVAPATDKAHQHVKTGDWQAFRGEWLVQPGEALIYPPPTPKDEPAGKASIPAAAASLAATAHADTVSNAKSKKRRKASDDAPETLLADEELPVDVELAVGEVLLSDKAEHASTSHA